MTKDILFLTPYNLFPPFWGGGTRTYNLVKQLSKNNEVHLLAPSYKQFKEKDGLEHRKKLKEEGVNVELVGPPTSWIQYINPAVFFKALYKIRKEDIDLIICDYPWSGIYTLALKKLTKIPYFLMEHNVEHEVAKQTGYEDPVLTKMLEKKVCDKAEEIFSVSEKDKKKICASLDQDDEKIHVLKNGFNADRFNPENGNGKKIREDLGIDEEDPIVFFCGKMDYVPNSEAVGFIYHEIMPRVLGKVPNAKFLIVGGGYDLEYSHDYLIFTGVVDNLVDYLKASDLVITPLKRGGGTRIKILEAIACGKDIVSTPKGAEGLLNEYTEPFIYVEDNWNDFSERIVDEIKNYEDPVPREDFFDEYAWKNIFSQIDDFVEKV